MKNSSSSQSTTLFLFLAVTFLASFSLSPSFLNMFLNYTLPGGGVFQKIHPSTYLTLFASIITLSKKIPPYNVNSDICNFIFSIFILALYGVYSGNFGYTSIIIDIFLFPAIFILLVSQLEKSHQVLLLKIFVAVTSVNTALVAFEFANKASLLVYEQELAYFRPAGIFGHPIAAGAACCIALLACRITVANTLARRTVMLILLCQVAMCGVRAALAVAALIFLSEILTNKARTPAVVIYDIFLVGALILAAFFFESVGAFDRILERGVWDDSAASRFDIFAVFNIMSNDEFWAGTSPDRILMYAQSLKQSRVESSFVVSVYQMGIVFSVILFFAIISYFIRPSLKSLNFLCIFGFIAMGTLYFGVKSPLPYPFFLLAYLISTHGNEPTANHSAGGLAVVGRKAVLR